YEKEYRPGKHPYHEAGVYYIQEPSAMAVVELLDPQPGETVLDLCAAPGGKSSHIGSRLRGRGLLVSNEIHPARAKILSQNMERMGFPNVIVTNEPADRLASVFPEFFDRIVVDAPCSGEGMFRKDENARGEWSPDHVVLCASRQREILDHAAGMLKPGGRLVYSTCTFSPEENEGSIGAFLDRHSDFMVEKVDGDWPFASGCPSWIPDGRMELASTFRIWPHQAEGEGHYLAVLKKQNGLAAYKRPMPSFIKDKSCKQELQKFWKECVTEEMEPGYLEELVQFGDQLYHLPQEMIGFAGLKVLRPGLHLGTLKKNRLEPSHALALSMKPKQARQWYDMAGDGVEILKYLKGETILVSPEYRNCHLEGKGWVLMTVDGFSVGWAKLAGGILKNHYPKGLRLPI
ncbi:MAG: RsmB/NOP family class I SAM-dependent RNA methyltransferase, partial [Lachnospiraceae bacterium]